MLVRRWRRGCGIGAGGGEEDTGRPFGGSGWLQRVGV